MYKWSKENYFPLVTIILVLLYHLFHVTADAILESFFICAFIALCMNWIQAG